MERNRKLPKLRMTRKNVLVFSLGLALCASLGANVYLGRARKQLHTQMASTRQVRILESWASLICKGVLPSSACASAPAILPISVFMPVPVTMAVAVPYVTEHPENTIYLPVEKANSSASVRRIISREDALHLLEELPTMEIIDHRDRREKQHLMEKAMKCHSCEEWCRVLKTLHSSRAQALAAGRKKSTTEEVMWKTAETCLTGEFAFVLGESREEAKERLQEALLAAYK